MADDLIARINHLRKRRATKAAELDALDAEITALIKEALTTDLGPTKLSKAIGISRARIYQIRDGRL